MTTKTCNSASEQSSILGQDGVKTPTILRRSDASIPGMWYRFKKRCSLARMSVLPPESKAEPSTDWKPLSMTAPVLLPVAASALCIAAAIEFLAQRSRLHGGLALAPAPDSISRYAMMSYLYLPTVLAVVFGLVWSWIDLDVKRMQPWFELSRPEGASAKNSLFLDYPYEFAALVPFRAFKRRHWLVFFSSTVVVAISWLITPLQSSILGINTIRISHPVSLNIRSKLASVQEQQRLIDPRALATGFSIGWLGQDYPPWLTDSYAILPFYVENDPGQSRPGTNWTANTTMLTTELDCWPAQVTSRSSTENSWNISSGYGCTAEYQLPAVLLDGVDTDFEMAYYGYEGNYSVSGNSLMNIPGYCPPTADSIHQSVAIWSEQKRVDSTSNRTSIDMAALFCQSHYFKQDVSITIAADTLKPDYESIVALAPRSPLTDQEFSSSAFEYLISHGFSKWFLTLDAPYDLTIDVDVQLAKYNLPSSASNLVAYALAGKDPLPVTAYRDPGVLHEAFNRAHQYLFSLTVGNVLVNETDFADHTATSSYLQSGIVVSRPISLAVEVLLVVAACCILALLRLSRLSAIRLRSNPSSLSRHVRIFQNSQDVNQLFYGVDCSDNKTLAELFPDDRFQLSHGTSGPHKLGIERLSDGSPDLLEKQPLAQSGYYKPFRPLALRRVSGLSFVLIQVGALAAVQVLKMQETRQQGLTRPSADFEVRQLLENFIPTIFATLTEPVLVQLNRFLCILQPFQALAAGRSIAAKSMDITYASFPPQLVIWRALRARHYLLGFMCAAALLSNVLAVGLGALFKEMPSAVAYEQRFRPALAPRFHDWVATNTLSPVWSKISTNLYTDHLYFALANFTSGTPLPPWTTAKYFFQPQVPEDTARSSNGSTYVVATRGFGASVNCTATGSYAVGPYIYDPAIDTYANGNCPETRRSTDFHLRGALPWEMTPGTLAREFSFVDGVWCSNRMTFGWARLPPGEGQNKTMYASFASCTPVLETATFNVTHDAQGNVISYVRTSALSTSLDYPASSNHTTQIMFWANNFLNQAQEDRFHNDTIARDWMSYLMANRMGSRDMLDALKPLPDPNQLIPFIADVYARLFAIMLSLNQQIFETPSASDEAVTVGARIDVEDKIFMASSAYLITTILLGLNVVAAGFFYSSALVTTLPRMPTSIGSMLAYVASSRMAQEGGPQEGGEGNRTYSFGRYMGVDKEPHLGIDVDPFVALIDPKSLKGGKNFFSSWKKDEVKRQSVRDGPWL